MDLSNLTDKELICQFKRDQDSKVFSELVKRYQKVVVQQCQHYLKNEEMAKDVSQEVFIRVLTKINSYRQESAFNTWLSTIIRNRCIDHLNQDKAALHQEISLNIVNTLEDELNTEDIEKPTIEILEEMLDKINGKEKLILLLKYKEEWSIREIQQSLNLSKSAVKMCLSRGREKMRKLLIKYKS